MSPSEAAGSTSSESPKRGIKRKRDPAKVSHVEAEKIEEDAQDSSGSDSNDSGSDSDSDNAEPEHESDDEAPQTSEVLSHAAQRKLKKQAKKEAEQPQSSSSRPQDDAADASQKRQNSIWVGNLAFKTTAEALRTFFQRGVPECQITRVNLPTKTGKDAGGGRGMRGENRGFAYIDFTKKEDKDKAIALSEQHLDGRKLLIKDGSDFTGRPAVAAAGGTVASGATSGVATSTVGKSKTAQRILAAQKQPAAPTLFLGNLGFQATEDSIRQMIEGHMKRLQKEAPKEKDVKQEEDAVVTKDKKVLKKVRMGTFEDSGLCKGFAFLDFLTTEDATAVLLDPRNHHLDGRKLVVEYASADAVRRGGGPGAKEHRDKREGRETGKSGGRRTEKSSGNDANSGETPYNEFDKTAPENEDRPFVKRQKREEGKQREDKGGKVRRTKPGAALALAQREKVAIVPSSGKKIVF